MSEPEGVAFAFLLFGFPWSVVAELTNGFALKWTYYLPLVFILNTATVYSVALAVVRLSNGSK